MALTRPFINDLPAFDALIGTKTYMSVLGGDAITSYTFTIYSEDTLLYVSPHILVDNDVSNATIRTFLIDLTNPDILKLLQNNKSYKIQPRTFNSENQGGQVGNSALFNCYKTPIIKLQYYSGGAFEDFKDGATVNAQKINTQIVFESLDLSSSAIPNISSISLYGETQYGDYEIVAESGNILNFVSSGFSHQGGNIYIRNFELPGFSVNVDSEGKLLPTTERIYRSYKIVLNLRTVDGMDVPSVEYSKINCYYKILDKSPYLIVNNICDKGVIEITSILTNYIGESYPYPPKYIDDKEIDLTASDANVVWANYFTQQQPYTLRIWGRDFNDGELLVLRDSRSNNKYISLRYNTEDEYNEATNQYTKNVFISLSCISMYNIAQNGKIVQYNNEYYIESERILATNITPSTYIFVGVQQQGSLFDIDFEIIK